MKKFFKILFGVIFLLAAHTTFAATITVTTSAASTAGDGSCSLAEALNNANSNSDVSSGDCTAGQALPTIDTIQFAIPGAGPHTIATSVQFNIAESVIIDGTTQSGTVCTLEGGGRALQVNIDASGISSNLNIFNVDADDVTIKGMAIYNNAFGAGIATWNDNTTVQCMNIGTDAEGLTAYPNAWGINVYNDGVTATSGHLFGGPNPGDGNLVSGNGFENEDFDGLGIACSASNITIQGNWIGIDRTGNARLMNDGQGIDCGNGGTVPYTNINILDNVISGNGRIDGSYSPGINLGSGAEEDGTEHLLSNVVVQGNFIGTNATGDAAITGDSDGMFVGSKIDGIIIGGPNEGDRNVISGNAANGIAISYTSNNITIQGNIIGLNAAGDAPVPNTYLGINIYEGDRTYTLTNILIGGDTEAEGNTISGNQGSGIYLDADDVVIRGNRIGTDATGLTCGSGLGNQNQGIQIGNQAVGTVIGGGVPGQGNVIGCNLYSGLFIDGQDTIASGNLIGVTASSANIANQGAPAIYIDRNAGDTLIGGETEADGNSIYNSGGPGIGVFSSDAHVTIMYNTIKDGDSGIVVNDSVDNDHVTIVSIIKNSIHNNSTIGIDLAHDLVVDGNYGPDDAATFSVQNQNDSGDGDTGPNGFINHPVILSTIQNGADTTVTYGLDVPVSGYPYHVEFFTNPTNGIHATGFGEGEVYVGYANVAHTALGLAIHSVVLTDVDSNDVITATVTACTNEACTTYGGTSEFSNTSPPGVDYDNTDHTAAHVINSRYLGLCVNGDNDDSSNGDLDGPNQIGAYLGTGPCMNDRDGVMFVKNEMTQSGPTLQEQYAEIADTPSIDDATFSGTYNGTENNTFQLAFASTAPDNGDDADYFIWIDTNDNIISDPIKVTPGVPQLLDHGIYVTFESGTGHTAIDLENFSFGQFWEVVATIGGLVPSNEPRTGAYAPNEDIALSITASDVGYVHVWVDRNRDGDFTDLDEWMVVNESVTGGSNGFIISAPNTPGTYTMRVRYVGTSTPDLGPTGVANDGEVEDYTFTVANAVTATPRRQSVGGVASSAYLASLGIKLGNQSSSVSPSASDTCPANQILTQNLKAGARNGKYHAYTKAIVTEVKILQAHMNRLGFKSGPEDGILGPITDGAIKRMQTFLGTKPDGYVGPITRSLINKSCGSGGLQKS